MAEVTLHGIDVDCKIKGQIIRVTIITNQTFKNRTIGDNNIFFKTHHKIGHPQETTIKVINKPIVNHFHRMTDTGKSTPTQTKLKRTRGHLSTSSFGKKPLSQYSRRFSQTFNPRK